MKLTSAQEQAGMLRTINNILNNYGPTKQLDFIQTLNIRLTDRYGSFERFVKLAKQEPKKK
jgi:hypothetical protein